MNTLDYICQPNICTASVSCISSKIDNNDPVLATLDNHSQPTIHTNSVSNSTTMASSYTEVMNPIDYWEQVQTLWT